MQKPVTAADLRAVSPFGDAKIIDQLASHINKVLPRYGIDTPVRIAHFLAQAAHETDGFNTLVEYGDRAYFAKRYGHRRDLGNLSKRDGPLFRGRGIFQLTGRDNYRRYGEKIGVPLEAKPGLAADPAVSLMVAGEYWQSRRLGELADRGKFESITRRINGGVNGIDDRRRYLIRAWRRFGKGALPVDAGRSDILDEGDSGPKVVYLQQRLKELGYHAGSVDGHFGALTNRALVAFQNEQGLEVDGIAGPQTLEALEIAAKPEPLRRVTATAAELRAKGSSTIKHADVLQKAAAAAAVIGTLKGSVDTGAMSFVENVTGSITQVKSVVTPFIDALTWLSSSLWITLIAGGLLTWLYAGRIIKSRVADHVSGKHIGR
jgi:putative chitinase